MTSLFVSYLKILCNVKNSSYVHIVVLIELLECAEKKIAINLPETQEYKLMRWVSSEEESKKTRDKLKVIV